MKETSFSYRPDIDGLRAIAVVLVILFHSGFTFFSGGYVGVDVFFVISGYLITSIVYGDVVSGKFSFVTFYKRRIARLVPSLLVLLVSVLAFGFVFYNERAFDNLGKEIFFSSFGLVNILFSGGENYFASEEAYRPLIHLWSLGVEEQFYACWPLVLLLIYKAGRKTVILVTSMLVLISLSMSEMAIRDGDMLASYYLPQYRAFELLIGAVLAIVLSDPRNRNIVRAYSPAITPWVGSTMILGSSILLDQHSPFPGLNALWPCLGTALVIAHGNHGRLCRLLSFKGLVFLGLISYPLYLFHQPVISWLEFFRGEQPAIVVLVSVIFTAVPLAWMSYKFIELPARRYARTPGSYKGSAISAVSVIMLAFAGYAVAKSNGLDARFKYLNPFAFDVANAHAASFHLEYQRGFSLNESGSGRVLFVGDSVLQQYVGPIAEVLGLSKDEIDIVSRGGCVLLKGVEFQDKFSDISCNSLRESLYEQHRHYERVFISQQWNDYGDTILNAPEGATENERWVPFLAKTIEHFQSLGSQIFLIGPHVEVEGVYKLQPSIAIDENRYRNLLSQLKVDRTSLKDNTQAFFSHVAKIEGVTLISPFEIFCASSCRVSDGEWSYFWSKSHLTVSSTPYLTSRLRELYF